MNSELLRWSKFALLNLVIVAAVGVILRYKILYPLPIVDHKNLLHGHSHFAFAGWVSLALFTAIVRTMNTNATIQISKYSRLFWFGQLVAFGMLLTFPFMGYKAPSIAFSTLSIFFSYIFAIFAWRDLNRSQLSFTVRACFKASLLFYVISSLGAFLLAYLMATKTGTQSMYIGSVYFFLHFQYNGWFLFAILGLFMCELQLWNLYSSNKIRTVFLLLVAACVPAFLLSALWMRVPVWVHWIAVAAALIQLLALILLWRLLVPLRAELTKRLNPITRLAWGLSLLAFSIKIVLQSLSTISSLSYLAFGFRPVVIGYLHLILLGFTSLFLLGYFVQQNMLVVKQGVSRPAILIFIVGVIINEVLLFTEGIAAIAGTSLPIVNLFLLLISLVMFGGLLVFWSTQRRLVHEQ